MKTETLDKIKKLNGAALGLETFWDNWKQFEADSNCDKKGAQFCGDNRFTVFSANITFDCYKGFYGNSSCSTFNNGIAGDVASEYLKRAINLNKHKIFEDMAKLMRKDAAGLLGAAEKEIEQLNAMLESVKVAA